MRGDDKFPDENLNQFLDGEMDPSQRAAFVDAMNKDDALGNRVCELMQMKDSIRIAYADPPQPAQHKEAWQRACQSTMLQNAFAAVALLAVGILAGIMLGPQLKYAQVADAHAGYPASATVNQPDRIILHVSESDPDQFSHIMDYLKEITNGRTGDDIRVDVIANAGGIDFMRTGVTPMSDQIVAMINAHRNIQFIACANGIQRLEKLGVEPGIIRGVHTDKAAMDHLVERLHAGWSYIRADTLSKTWLERSRAAL